MCTISRRAFAGGALALGLGGKARSRRALPDSARARKDLRPSFPARLFLSGRSRPASGLPHRVVVRHRESHRCGRRRLRRAVDLVSPGIAAGRRRRRLGQSADLDGPCGGHPRRTHRFSEKFARGGVGQAGVEAKPFQGLDRFLGNARRAKRCAATTIAPLELNASGADFSYALRLDADRAAGAAGRRRLQPEIANADRPRIISASPISGRQAASPSTTSLSKSPAWPGWTGNGAASRSLRIKPDGTGFRCISTPAKS